MDKLLRILAGVVIIAQGIMLSSARAEIRKLRLEALHDGAVDCRWCNQDNSLKWLSPPAFQLSPTPSSAIYEWCNRQMAQKMLRQVERNQK